MRNFIRNSFYNALRVYLEFSEDYIFSSPSTAACIVLGRNANGLTEWKMENGKSLKDYESKI